jgi:hypothetical protein
LRSKEVDIAVINIWKEAALLVGMLNPYRRAKYGTEVVELMRAMRKFESANVAATLWNQITI